MHHLSMENMPRMPCDGRCRGTSRAVLTRLLTARPDARTKSPKMAARYHTLCAIQQ